MGGKTEATRSPMTKKSQLMSIPILMRMIDQRPANSAKMSTDSRDTISICTRHPCYALYLRVPSVLLIREGFYKIHSNSGRAESRPTSRPIALGLM